MKYFNIIAVRCFLILITLLINTSGLFAQDNFKSPYSIYGLGLINNASFNSNFGSGGIGYAWRPTVYKPLIYDSLSRSNPTLNDRKTNYINIKNPASLSNISLTTFEVALVSRGSSYEINGEQVNDRYATIGHIALAFPIGEFAGMTFGLRPLSNVGYSYVTYSAVQGVSSTNKYEVEGGLNELFMGVSHEIGKNLAIGFTGKYIFGKIQDNKRVSFTAPNFFNTIDRTELVVSSLAADMGLQYYKQLNSNYRMVFGLTASPLNQLDARRTNLIATYTGADNLERIKDTIRFENNKEINLPFISTIGGGISIEKIGQWAAELDFTSQVWSSNQAQNGVQLSDGFLINMGIEKFNALSSFGSYFSRMGYRFGMNYNSSIVNIDGTDIDQMALNLGFSLPLRKSFSTLNFGIELGKRGTNENNLIEEQFFNFQIGVTINDKWFIKRKYD